MISNLLQVEESYMVSYDYLKVISNNNIDVSMRTTLTTWMLEVCEEEQCTNEIYSLSVNLFDRLMCVLNNRVEKYHLQLFGIVCLFIAAKLKSITTLTSTKLIDYTDNSINLEEFLEWELMVLDKLKWDIAAVCPNDYLEYFIQYYTNQLKLSQEQVELITKHSFAFTALCSTDFKFSFYPASMIASACFLTALNGITSNNSSLIDDLAMLTQTDADFLQSVKESVEFLFKASPQEESTVKIDQESLECPIMEEELFSFESQFKKQFSNDSFKLDKSFHEEFNFSNLSDFSFDEISLNETLSTKSKNGQKLKNKVSAKLQRQSNRRSGRARG